MKTGLSTRARWIATTTSVGVALAIIAAVSPFSAFDAGRDPNYSGANLFSYFTVQSNLIAAITLCIGAYALLINRRLGQWFGVLRGGAVLYMTVTALVYALLLQNNPDVNTALGFDWKNFVLHQAAPLYMVAMWLLWPSREAISARQSLVWLVFPVVWLIYTFIRAGFTGWYPYPFLNPDKVGSRAGVALYVAGITIGFVLLCLIVAWISRERRRNTTAA